MPVRRIGSLLFVAVVILLASACVRPVEEEPWTTFRRPLINVRQAAFTAFEVIGIDVTVNDALYIEGMRPLRMKGVGIVGGETVRIWLEPLEENRTRVRIYTVYRGNAQTDWTGAVFREMTRVLGEWE
jgi:hypothetical protein